LKKFIDTSVFVAILAREPGWEKLVLEIEGAKKRYTSGLVKLETVMRASTMLDIAPMDVEISLDLMI